MAVSQISDVRQALVALFSAVGYSVFAFPPGDTNTATPKSLVFLNRAASDQEHFTMGGSRTELITVGGAVNVFKAGATDAVAKTAEDEALAIVAELEDGLRATPGLSDAEVFHAEFGGIDASEVVADPAGRVAIVEFNVRVEAHI